jgi:hypothetical protein
MTGGGTTKTGTLYNPKEYMTSCFTDPVGGDRGQRRSPHALSSERPIA